MLMLCYPKCSTCKKAIRHLEEKGLKPQIRDISRENPTAEELRGWIAQSGLPIKRFFNTSGNLYKAMHLKDRLETMSDEEKIALLASDGMLVKRPLLINGDQVLVGYRPQQYDQLG